MRSKKLPLTLLLPVLALLATAPRAGAALTYQTEVDGAAQPLAVGDTLEFPSLTAGEDSSVVTVRVLNTGEEVEQIDSIKVEGAAFTLAPLAEFPILIGSGSALVFQIRFNPPAPGEFGGRLSIDADQFPLSGEKPAVQLSLSLRLPNQTLELDRVTRVSLPSVTAGGRLEFTIVVKNLGGLAGQVTFLDLSGYGFALLSAPVLPATVGPGESLEVNAQVAPKAAGNVMGVLRVNDRSVQIESVGGNPPQLQEIRITDLPNPAPPLAQPAIGLELAEPYPADLVGRLTLDFTSESFVSEPTIVFSTGTRQVDVRIPAGSTRAILGPDLDYVLLQTGTTAGVITLSASLTAAGIDVTGGSPLTYSVRVVPSEPQIYSLDVTTVGDRSFDLMVTGFATSRSLSELEFQFQGRPGVRLDTTELSLDVERAFASWYRSQASQSFGSQFTATVRVTLSVEATALDSVTVTAANELGKSAPKTLGLR